VITVVCLSKDEVACTVRALSFQATKLNPFQ
jgi:hypothetical protein